METQGKRSVVKDILSIYVPAFFIMTGMSVVSPILSIYAKSFGVDYVLAALAISIFAFGRLFADLPVGMLGDRIGRRPVLLIGVLIIAATAFLNAYATSFWEFLLYRLLEGVGSAMFLTMRVTMLQDILKPEERGRILGYFQAFMLIGSSSGPTIGGLTAQYWGLQAPFLVYCAGSLICLVLAYFLIPETGRAHSPSKNQSKQETVFSWEAIKRLFGNLTYLTACIATFTTFLERQGIRVTLIPLYSSVELNLNSAEIGYVTSCAMFTNLLVVIPVGHALDRLGRKKVLVPFLAGLAIVSIAFPFTRDFVQIALVCVFLGACESGTAQSPLTMASDATMNEPHGVAMALYRVFGDAGYVVGPIMVGALSDMYGLRIPFYAVAALIFVSTALIQIFAKETLVKKKKSEPPSGETISRVE